MIVLKSTKEFEIKGIPYPNFPLLTWTTTNLDLGIQNGMLFEEGLAFLKYELIRRGRVDSTSTWETYANHLAIFFSFCEDNELNWKDIKDDDEEDEMLLAVFRDVCVTDFNLSANTTNQYLRTIIRFYQFAVGKGYVPSLPYSLEAVSANKGKHSFQAHTVNTNESYSPDVVLKTVTKPPKFLQTEQIQVLLKTIKNPTLKLMVRLCLQTGIRKKELLLFPLEAIRKPRQKELVCKVEINRTKGEKERTIDVPAHLMEDLWRYVNELRFQQAQSSGVDSPLLFLTTEGEEWSLDSKGLNKALNDLRLPFRVTPHMLRHTYATHMLKALQERKNTKFEPLMYLQNRLGHSHIGTTMKYLHVVSDLLDDLSLEYQDQINAVADSAIAEQAA